jgi:ribosomal protein S18 acetylase RimI-like enzyme
MFQRMPELFKLRVVVDKRTGRIVGAGTLLIEPKFIHQCGWTGHIEDIVVHEDARGLGLGKLYATYKRLVSSKSVGLFRT